ncbi:DUF3530 family protein [Paraglaciecola sp. L1A13]|uniref:DUF3530 family protein n=1 Tax=Paraglaciecola sp. L1A13 TaxID=2686359 RepID=UPI00131E3821|nr:DUF3530 family protein [Paraglaciecola sp. L1A13]
MNIRTTTFYCLIAYCITLAQYAASASTLSDVQRQLFPDKAKVLQVNQDAVPLIESQNTTSNLNGVVILIGESGRPPVSQQNLAMLTQYLNDLGWVTMQVSPPTIGFEPDLAIEDNGQSGTQSNATPTDETPTETREQNPQSQQSKPATPSSPQYQIHRISNAHFLEHEAELKELIKATMLRAQEYSGFRLVIAQGSSAAWLIKIYAEKQIPNPDAMVAISPFWPQRNLNSLIAKYTAITEMPILDIYSAQDNSWSLLSAAQRTTTATKSLKLDYRQRELTSAFNTKPDSAFVSKEIYGWLHNLGW